MTMSGTDSAGDESLYPIAVLIDELRNEDVQVSNLLRQIRLKFVIIDIHTPFSGLCRRQCMHSGNRAGSFSGSAVRRLVGHDSAAAMSKLVALLLNYMQIVQNWSEKGVVT